MHFIAILRRKKTLLFPANFKTHKGKKWFSRPMSNFLVKGSHSSLLNDNVNFSSSFHKDKKIMCLNVIILMSKVDFDLFEEKKGTSNSPKEHFWDIQLEHFSQCFARNICQLKLEMVLKLTSNLTLHVVRSKLKGPIWKKSFVQQIKSLLLLPKKISVVLKVEYSGSRFSLEKIINHLTSFSI